MHPLIGLAPSDTPQTPEPPKAPEPALAGRSWCADCDYPGPAHAPDCPRLRDPATPEPPPRRVPTWKGAFAKALQRLAKRLEDGGSKDP